MIKGSFWWPANRTRVGLLLAIGAMVLIHQSELFGVMDSQVLVFGWLPMQLAYDILFNLVGVGILYAMYRLAPEPPSELIENSGRPADPVATAEESPEVTTDGGR